MNDNSDIANRPTRMLEAGVLFGIAIDAIRDIKVHPRKGGQRSALVSIVFSVIALSSGKPPEIIRTALTRAYFCEEISRHIGLQDNSSGLFLMGLLSVADALLDKPMSEVLKLLPVSPEIKTALCGGQNSFRDAYDLLLAFERADWARLVTQIQRLHG
jgi:c-di-GMP-related signal transduction protein